MIGIYTITSPSGKVYIGQSWDIKKRLYYYTKWENCKDQIGISRSIKKYGFTAHKVDIIQTLQENCTQYDLDQAEIFHISQHQLNGVTLLNMKEGGSGGRLSQHSIEKIKIKRRAQHPPTLGKTFSVESKMKMSASQKGRKMSPEAIEKSRRSNTGRKATETAKANLRAARAAKNVWIGRTHTEESKRKQSLAKIGNEINNKAIKRVDTGEVFVSLKAAAKSIGLKPATLSARICHGINIEPKFEYLV